MNPPNPSSSVAFSPEEWQALREQFSELKHTLNNALAVFMALSELATRNPDNYEKLRKAVADRTPQIVALMQEFTQAMDAKKGVGPG